MAYFRAFCAAFLPWIQASSANADAARSALRYAATSLVQFWARMVSPLPDG